MTRLPACLLWIALSASCVSADLEMESAGGKADSPHSLAELIDGTAAAVGLLRFVNDPGTTGEILDDEVGLKSDAARNIVEHRDGLVSGNQDLFDDIAELDHVSQVGPEAFERLLDFAFDNGLVPEGSEILGNYDGVDFSVDEAARVVLLVNTASEATLDVELALDGRAVSAIIEARPIATVLALSKLSFVGGSALEKLKADQLGTAREIGVLSDLDKTIVPPAPSGQALPDAPYPGIAELLTILEFGEGTGQIGDLNFVTARQPNMVIEIPDWLANHGIPTGPISTGISGIPNIARAEKIRDITEVFEANPDQNFVMFGDSSHVDPDAYRSIRASFAGRVEVAFIHNVKTIDPARLEGLVLIDNYAQAAAELFRIGLVSEDQARMVMQAVVAGGEISDAQLESLIAANRP